MQAPAVPAWKEFTAPDGRKYYYNKGTKESKWTLPDEMKAAAAAATATSKAPPVVQVVKAEPKPEVVEVKPEAKTEPKADPTGKHMYATKVCRARPKALLPCA